MRGDDEIRKGNESKQQDREQTRKGREAKRYEKIGMDKDLRWDEYNRPDKDVMGDEPKRNDGKWRGRAKKAIYR